jgi:hypothetical protein
MWIMLQNLPTWLRAAVITGFQTFLGSFLVLLIGLLSEVQDWVDGGAAPNLEFAAKAIVSLVIAFVTGTLTALYRAVRPVENTYPEPPKP